MKKGLQMPRRAAKTQTPPKPKPAMLKRAVTRREAAEAADRLRTTPAGTRYVIRFSTGQRIEHLVLLFSFTGLAITGLAQTFYTTALGTFVLDVFGGIDNDRAMHHILAFIFIVLSVYHVGLFVYQRFVNRRTSKMFPEWSDFEHLLGMLRYNLGISQRFPRFDRYTFEEKAEYWALIWGGTVMGLTGLMQWYPVFVTDVLPGWAIPVARAFHRWEAILAVLAILTWHFYHVVLKELNLSMFTGNMTMAEMEEQHPLELAYLEKAAAAVGSKIWPVIIEIPLEEPPVETTPVPAQAVPAPVPAEAAATVLETPQPAEPEVQVVEPSAEHSEPIPLPMPTTENATDGAA